MDLSEFLLARIAEDEAGENTYATAIGASTDHDQRRWWAECEAKRRIIDLAQQARSQGDVVVTVYGGSSSAPPFGAVGGSGGGGGGGSPGRRTALEQVLRLLALPYADHPDYSEEWRP